MFILKRAWPLSVLLLLIRLPALGTEAVSLTTLLEKVREKNPEVLAARRAANVKTEEARAAGVWDNPRFSYIDEEFPSGTPATPTEKVRHYRLEQAIPFPGKLTLDARMKHHEALIAGADAQAKLLEKIGEARMRYYQLYLTGRQIALGRQSVEILKNALAGAQGRLSANKTSTADAFMAQAELAKQRNALYVQEQQRRLAEIALNGLLNQDPDVAWGDAEAPRLAELPVTLPQAQDAARQNNPLYLNARHELNHAGAMQAHNKLEWAPDFGVLVEREQAAGQDGRQIGVSVSFPLWFQRPWHLGRAGDEHLQEAQATAENMQNMARTMVATEFTEVQTHRTTVRHFEDEILPAVQTSLKISQLRYASGQTNFLHLLEAFRAWISAQAEYAGEVYHVGEHWTELERWMGVDIDQVKEMHHD